MSYAPPADDTEMTMRQLTPFQQLDALLILAGRCPG